METELTAVSKSWRSHVEFLVIFAVLVLVAYGLAALCSWLTGPIDPATVYIPSGGYLWYPGG
jgi:hypothetical protein